MRGVLDEVFISDQLALRRSTAPRFETEIPVLQELARTLAVTPQTSMDRLVELSLDLCGAESGGISLLQRAADGEESFAWHGLKGNFAQFLGTTMPRDFSPCGTVLDLQKPILVRLPERYYPYLQLNGEVIREGLLVPLTGEDGGVCGTLWIATHDPEREFTQADCETLTRLATFGSASIVLTRIAVEKDELLAEKERLLIQQQMMLREVNHRVSNSLQLANALLRLQSKRATGEEAKRELKEAANRIESIALVHTRLYQTGEMSAVDVGRYLRDLCADLTSSVRGRGADRQVEIKVATPAYLSVPPDAMTKIGLIVNELVTNAIKHAQQASHCRVAVAVADDKLELVVSDDGPGLAEGFDLAAQSGLGMRMVQSLVDQLGGRLTATPSSAGAYSSISVPFPAVSPA